MKASFRTCNTHSLRWVNTQRKIKDSMSSERKQRLDEIGAMMSSPEEVQWDINNGAEYKAYLMNEMTG